MTRLTWDEYAMAFAETARSRSEDPYKAVGACLMRADHTVAAMGYNGAPAGVEVDWSDREARRPWVLHAEMNALRYVRPGEVETLATTYLPCYECMKVIASYGIKRVIYAEALDPRYFDEPLTRRIAAASSIELTQVTND